MTFDLTGLPPTRKNRRLPGRPLAEAYERVVDRLLASPAYGERMAADWLDIARYADSHGYQDDGMREMWPWRDWVIGVQPQPARRRVHHLALAGDSCPPTQEQRIATGFNRNHMQSREGGIVPEEYRTEYVARVDRVNTLGRAFLGLSVECARCHDH